MLRKIKKFVLRIMYTYHRKVADYCFRKVDEYGPERNYYWEDKVVKHTRKEFELFERFVKLGDI